MPNRDEWFIWTARPAPLRPSFLFERIRPHEAVHIRRQRKVSHQQAVTWRLCAAGQMVPVLHLCAGKARRISFCRAPVGGEATGKPPPPESGNAGYRLSSSGSATWESQWDGGKTARDQVTSAKNSTTRGSTTRVNRTVSLSFAEPPPPGLGPDRIYTGDDDASCTALYQLTLHTLSMKYAASSTPAALIEVWPTMQLQDRCRQQWEGR